MRTRDDRYVTFTVPGRPAPFIRATGREYNIARKGSSHKDAAIRRYLDYKESVQDYARFAMVGHELITSHVDVSVALYIKRARTKRWDTINVYKAIEDAMNGIVYDDDKRVRSVHIGVYEATSFVCASMAFAPHGTPIDAEDWADITLMHVHERDWDAWQ